jgi:hypothetical protein
VPVKTDWHETEAACVPDLSGVDPFETASLPSMDALSLDIPAEELQRRLRLLVKREGNLFAEGVVCRIKDNDESSCLACPLNQIGKETAKAALCGIGCDQERVVTLMLAQRERV